jgi:hypothetical protein
MTFSIRGSSHVAYPFAPCGPLLRLFKLDLLVADEASNISAKNYQVKCRKVSEVIK